MEIRKEIMEKRSRIEIERKEMMVGNVRMGSQRWKLVGVYINKNMEEMLQSMAR